MLKTRECGISPTDAVEYGRLLSRPDVEQNRFPFDC